MPTLLIINITCNQGSTGKIAEHVGIMMQNKGWDVYYAHGARRVNPSQLKTIPFSSVSAEYMHALRSRLFDEDGLGSEKETRYLVEQIKIIKPDIIHIHNIHGYYLNYKILFEYLNKTNIQIVKTLHDCWDFTGHCTHFVTANCEKWKSECLDCPLSNKEYPKSFFDMSTRNYRLKAKFIVGNQNLHLVPVSHWLEGLLRQSMYKGKDIRVIRNGIDIKTFSPQQIITREKYGIDKQKKIILLGVASPWSERKGLKDYVKLSKELDSRFVILLVGLTDAQIEKLPDNIIGIKRTQNQRELACLYSMADILLSLSYAETFGMTMAEAYACGTPCIVYDNTAQPEIVTPQTGRIAKTGDIDELVRLIYEMTESKFKQNHSTDCRKRAEEHFNKDKCFEKYIELYNRILEDK